MLMTAQPAVETGMHEPSWFIAWSSIAAGGRIQRQQEVFSIRGRAMVFFGKLGQSEQRSVSRADVAAAWSSFVMPRPKRSPTGCRRMDGGHRASRPGARTGPVLAVALICSAGGGSLGAQDLAPTNAFAGDSEAIRAGMGVYRLRCADCHGTDAPGGHWIRPPVSGCGSFDIPHRGTTLTAWA
jgi:hypothetical protein